DTHFRATKRVIRYVKGTLIFGIKFYANKKYVWQGYSDSDWGGSSNDMKSTSSYCFNLSSRVFSRCSKKKEIVAQSMAEVELIPVTTAANQALWLRKLLPDINLMQENCTEVFVDNQEAIAISNNPIFHGKTKHFNIKLFILREAQKEGLVGLKYCKILKDQLG
ncbi:hypothetical protein MTR67_023412, partial [Solanum verrucosum]